MKLIAINGSPRKTWNTATLLKKAAEGAQSVGAEAELIHLYDLNFQGCTSCFACKKKNSAMRGHCVMKDDLSPILETILQCDALLLGSPIYFSNVTGELLSMMERMMFSILSYDGEGKLYYSKTIKTGFIYTMNAPQEALVQIGVSSLFESMQARLQRFYSAPSPYMLSCDTYQFSNYGEYEVGRFDLAKKEKQRSEQFPHDCEEAYAFGKQLVSD